MSEMSGSIIPYLCTGVFIKKEDGSTERVEFASRNTPQSNALWLKRKIEKHGSTLYLEYEASNHRARDIAKQIKILHGVRVCGYHNDGSIDIGFESITEKMQDET